MIEDNFRSIVENKYRIAFVLKLDDSDEVGEKNSIKLVKMLIKTISESINADMVYCKSGEDKIAYSIDKFWNIHHEDLNLQIPMMVEICKNEYKYVMMVCELWTCVGGPYPYSDSYTYSAYVNSSCLRQEICNKVRAMCVHCNIPLPVVLAR